MSEREMHEEMAAQDIFFSLIIVGLGVFGIHKGWVESSWGEFSLYILLFLLGAVWLSARIYHLTHKDEVFGDLDDS